MIWSNPCEARRNALSETDVQVDIRDTDAEPKLCDADIKEGREEGSVNENGNESRDESGGENENENRNEDGDGDEDTICRICFMPTREAVGFQASLVPWGLPEWGDRDWRGDAG